MSMTVDAASPRIRYDSAAVGGVITRDQIERVPLNGRSFLELAQARAGAAITNEYEPQPHRSCPSWGRPRPTSAARASPWTAAVSSSVGFGGSQMGFSQEVVQEFQVATVNFDPSAGLTAAGAVNVVTRAGSNDIQGTAFYFLRDHRLAAYPALNRDQDNSDPVIPAAAVRIGDGRPGPPRGAIFYFGSWERNDQRAVTATTLLIAGLRSLEPYHARPASRRPGQRTCRREHHAMRIRAFARYSHDRSRAFGPGTAIGPLNAYPSSWSRAVDRR